MSKTYTMDIAYGKYYSDEGTFVSLCADQGDGTQNGESLAALFHTTADDPDFDWDIQSVTIPQTLVESIQKDAAQQGSGLDSLLAKVVKEHDFQKQKAKEFGQGIFRDETLFARYDQATIILDWVIKTIQEEQGTVS